MKKILHSLFLLFPLLCFSQTPDWQWARNYTLSQNAGKQYTAADNDGNVYLIGDFAGPTLTVGTYTLTNFEPATSDIYIIKFDKDGNVLWARSEGGTWYNHGASIGLDNQGNFYVLGTYHESITIGTTTLTNTDGGNFYAKFDSSGNPLWAKSFNEPVGSWSARDVKTDASGNMYMAGHFIGPSVTLGGVTLVNPAYSSTNVAPVSWFGKFDGSGNCIWLRGPQSTAINSTGNLAHGIDIDSNGNVYVAGQFNNATINFGNVTLTKSADYDYTANMYLVKYDANGNALWGKNAGSEFSNLTIAETVSVDPSNNVLVSGFFSNTISFDAISLMAGGGSKPYTAKFDTNGTALWAKNTSGANCAGNVYGVDTDSQGNIYVVGTTNCASLNFGGLSLSMSGEGGIYVVKYNTAGQPLWARRSSATNINNVVSIDVHNENEIYVAGTFFSPTISFGTNALTKSSSNFDLFIAKLNYTPLGTEEFSKAKIVIAPNPATDILELSGLEENTAFEIIDLRGRKIAGGVLDVSNPQIKIDALVSGIYMLRLLTSVAVTLKFVKE
ncbi:MAG: T9SS type A sorting domain-containing protein [Flavobacterium sp.]|uniref:SBBP repeat-containing protein n=1 Tax=Flavobacterium sp. TaxID=239 RepID=UPI0011F544BD|nr:SBBP repeat-containing protein [Flavobacterium sp.]RZJ64345.1 MAG: T9SS type A sorting domain-containing protein [Flavobacterium sp.]